MSKGVLYIILSGLSFMIVNFFVKILGQGENQELFEGIQRYPAHELVLARSIVSFSMSYYVIRRMKIPFWGNNKKWLVIRAFSGIIALTLFFYTIHYLPLAIASTVQYLAPVFTIILAIFLLKEKVKMSQWLFILIAFIGVGLIAIGQLSRSDSNQVISGIWLGLGIISAAFSGLAYTAIMKLKYSDKPITIVMYFPMIAIPIMTLFCLYDFTFPQGIEWLILIIIGVFTQIAQILLTKALHNGDASTITPFQYLGAIYAYLVGLFVFNEQLSFIMNMGLLLVLVGIIANILMRKV